MRRRDMRLTGAVVATMDPARAGHPVTDLSDGHPTDASTVSLAGRYESGGEQDHRKDADHQGPATTAARQRQRPAPRAGPPMPSRLRSGLVLRGRAPRRRCVRLLLRQTSARSGPIHRARPVVGSPPGSPAERKRVKVPTAADSILAIQPSLRRRINAVTFSRTYADVKFNLGLHSATKVLEPDSFSKATTDHDPTGRRWNHRSSGDHAPFT